MNVLEKIREKLTENNIDGILVSNPTNRRYLSNFTGSAGLLLITHTKAIIIVDFRYIEQAKMQAVGFEVYSVKRNDLIYSHVEGLIDQFGISKLGYETEYLVTSEYLHFQKVDSCELIPTYSIVHAIRTIKSNYEINMIKKAAEIADSAFNHVISIIKPGMTEKQIANELEFYMRKEGAISSSFDIIVCSGERGALPHGIASDKVIKKFEMVTLDFGANYEGYRSDITRTIAVGEPKQQLKEIYDIVLRALYKGLEGIKPGITGREADQLTRELITGYGYGLYFGHGTGHGLGLDIHEEPFLHERCNISLEPGMVLTVEPGIYIPGLGGVRIEDDILVTTEGNEVLTHSPRDLLIID